MNGPLRGPVRRVRTESAQWDLTAEVWKEPERVIVEEYRPDGQSAGSEHRFGANVSRTVFEYDDAGLLVESHFWNGDQSQGRSVYEYDGGRLVRVVGDGADGPCVVEERTYAPDGSHERIMPLRENSGISDLYTTAIDGLDFWFSAPFARLMITRFDREGRAFEVRVKDGMGREVRRLAVERDARGLPVKAELFSDEPLAAEFPALGVTIPLMTVEYAYDEGGRQIEMVWRILTLSDRRETYSYDQYGNRTATTSEETEFEGHLGEDGTLQRGAGTVRRQQTRFEYRYDAQGNWIENVTSSWGDPNPDFTPACIERREIDYYIPGSSAGLRSNPNS